MQISLTSSGSFDKTERFLARASKLEIRRFAQAAAQKGVQALASATPVDSGLAANSWSVEVTGGRGFTRITWRNTNVESGFPVAVMIQTGYGTGTGGFVQGRDYINPAIRPIFDQIADDVWRAVTSNG